MIYDEIKVQFFKWLILSPKTPTYHFHYSCIISLRKHVKIQSREREILGLERTLKFRARLELPEPWRIFEPQTSRTLALLRVKITLKYLNLRTYYFQRFVYPKPSLNFELPQKDRKKDRNFEYLVRSKPTI